MIYRSTCPLSPNNDNDDSTTTIGVFFFIVYIYFTNDDLQIYVSAITNNDNNDPTTTIGEFFFIIYIYFTYDGLQIYVSAITQQWQWRLNNDQPSPPAVYGHHPPLPLKDVDWDSKRRRARLPGSFLIVIYRFDGSSRNHHHLPPHMATYEVNIFSLFSLNFFTNIFFSYTCQLQLIPIEVEFCIEEWSTGLFAKRSSFDEAENLARYTAHAEKLAEWRSLNATVVDKMLQKRFDRIRYVLQYPPTYNVFMVKQEKFRYSDNQGNIYQDVKYCKGNRDEGARRTHGRHWQWSRRLERVFFISRSYSSSCVFFSSVNICNMYSGCIIWMDFLPYMKPIRWM